MRQIELSTSGVWVSKLDFSRRTLRAQVGRTGEPGTHPSHAPVGVDDRLPVGAGLLKPLAGELLTYLVKIRLQRLTRRQHLYATGRELLSIPLGLLFRGLPGRCRSGVDISVALEVGAVGRALALRHDAFEAHLAGVGEHGGAVGLNVRIEQARLQSEGRAF
jgi:hypothetical protein